MAVGHTAPIALLAPLLLAAISASPAWATAMRQEQYDAKIKQIVSQITRYGQELAGQSDASASEICARSSASLMDLDAVVNVSSEDVRDRMSPAQRDAYRDAATRWIIRRCVQENRGNRGENPQFLGVRRGDSGDRLLALKTETPPHFVIWRLRGDEKPRVVDVIMDGVSMALTLRNETNALLGQDEKDVDGMIKALARRGRDAAGGQ
ncbi:MAG: ABC transporter substrate-binding protein [Methylocystis sp.]|uniref:ABC transporter substrate-binding protein n=1 Tax=Methylocystis sp. TaxID=1911079 RepID=UPI003DA65F1B